MVAADIEDNTIVEAKWGEMARPSDPMVEAEIATYLADVEFPVYGHYFVQLWINGMYIMERRIVVLEPQQPEENT